MQAGESVIQEFGDAQEYLIRVPVGGGTLEEVSKRIDGGLRQAGLPGFEVRRLEFVGPQVGRDLQWDAVQAVLWGMVGILVYTAFRFDFKGGVAAILALMHDVLISVGAMSLAQPRDVAAGAGGAPDHRRLLDQRHDRDVRPDPGEPRAGAPEGRDPWPT